MRTKSRAMAAMANMALVLISCLAGLALVETALRLFHPKYEHLAETPAVRLPNGFHTHIPKRRGTFQHPDTGDWHPSHYNNLGSRQLRNFHVAELESAVNIGFFGDSFTENTRMAAQFSFTEPLDHLLNVNAGGVGGRLPGTGSPLSLNVLNFGREGYNLDFHWHSFEMLLTGSGSLATGPLAGAPCMTYRRLPSYTIERIRTGQFVAEGNGVYKRLWEGEHVLPAG